jgi:hypothetical protein
MPIVDHACITYFYAHGLVSKLYESGKRVDQSQEDIPIRKCPWVKGGQAMSKGG